MSELLFSYGTLQHRKVQIESFGRVLEGEQDTLFGYRLDDLKIVDPNVLEISDQQIHPIAVKSNSKSDCIEGIIYEISEKELKKTDQYEVHDYQRVLETFESGKKAWIYISKK